MTAGKFKIKGMVNDEVFPVERKTAAPAWDWRWHRLNGAVTTQAPKCGAAVMKVNAAGRFQVTVKMACSSTVRYSGEQAPVAQLIIVTATADIRDLYESYDPVIRSISLSK